VFLEGNKRSFEFSAFCKEFPKKTLIDPGIRIHQNCMEVAIDRNQTLTKRRAAMPSCDLLQKHQEI
jgi:hypothetical protein